MEAVLKTRENTGRNVHLLLVGEGPIQREMNMRTQPAHIHLLGFRDDVVECFALSDVGALASSYPGESAPLCVIECLAAGRPMIATDCGEISTMINADSAQPAGVLIPVRSYKERVIDLTNAISRMAEDALYHRELCTNTVRAVGRYTMANIGAAYADIFLKLASKRIDQATDRHLRLCLARKIL